MSKVYCNHSELSDKLLRGVATLAENVGATLGPKGRNVILKKKGERPIITKDGVTVASFVDLSDPVENLGAQVIKQAAQVTADEAGDGTTTSTVLSHEIFQQATAHLSAGISPVEIKRGMDKAVEAIINELKEVSSPVETLEDILNIATVSANGDKHLGNLISQAIDKAGKDGAISIEPANSSETSLELIEGFQIDSGYLSPQFVTDKRRWTMRHESPLILVTDTILSTVEQIFPTLQIASREGRALVVVAEDVQDQALAALVMNAVRGSMKVAAIRAPGYGEERRACLEDLAASVGATVLGPAGKQSLTKVDISHLGTVKVCEAKKTWATFVGGSGDPDVIEQRIEQLKAEIAQTESLKECEAIQRRVNRLASGVAILKVGGTTEVEMMEAFHRAEDALQAVRSAQEDGIVPGGGTALLQASTRAQGVPFDTMGLENEDQALGARIVFSATSAPLRRMAQNAGLSTDIVEQTVRTAETGYGFDFSQGCLADMCQVGIIDPLKVTKTALTNAVSAAGTLITTSHGIVEIE